MEPAEERFERIYRDYYDSIWRYVQFKAAGLEAEDVVAEVFTTAWRRLEKIPQDNPAPWLYTVARHKIGDAIREKKKRRRIEQRHEGLRDTAVVNDPVAAVASWLTFERALMALDSDLNREILYLHVHDGLPSAEIAEIVGLRRQAVSMRILRICNKLAGQWPSVSPSDDVTADEPDDGSTEGRKQ